MKLKQLFASLTLASLTLLSCSQDSEVHPLPEPSQEPATKVVQVTLETEEGTLDNGLRLDQQIDPTSGKPTSPLMSDKPVKIRIAVRLNNDNTTSVYQTLTFEKVGPLKVRYQGALTVPVGSTPETDKYYISGILLSEDGVDGRVFTEIEGDEATSSIVTMKPATGLVVANESNVLTTTAPYYSAWKEVTLVDGTNRPVTMTFKPSGTLLRFQVTNPNDTDVTVEGIKVETNAFFKDWKYDFSNHVGYTNLAEGQRADLNSWSETYTFASPEQLSYGGWSKWYYIWVMPVTMGTPNLSTKITVLHSGGKESVSFQTSVAPTPGSIAVKLPLKIDSYTDGNFGGYDDGNWGESAATNGFPKGKLPYEYIGGLLNAAGDGVLDLTTRMDVDDARIGYRTYNQTMAINLSGYKVPSFEEIGVVFPLADRFPFTDPTYSRNKEEYVVMSGQRIRVLGDFRMAPGVDYTDKTALYAIRFKSSSNNMRMAYKYEHVYTSPEVPSMQNAVKVSMKYVGTDSSVDVSTISGENRAEFWSGADVKHYYFPLTGEKSTDGVYEWKVGVNMHVITSDLGLGTGSRYSWFWETFLNTRARSLQNRVTSTFPILMLKTNP